MTELSMVVHVGTHVDSPRHFFTDGPALEDVPLTRLMGPGVVWQLDVPFETTIEPDDLEQMRPVLEPGDILLLDTGAASHVGTDYHRHPSLSTASAEWLVERQVKLLGRAGLDTRRTGGKAGDTRLTDDQPSAANYGFLGGVET